MFCRSAGAATAVAIAIAIETIGGAACAQDHGERYRECYEGGVADRVIAACSVVIGERAGDRQDIAAAFKNRGDAHDDKGEYELALADYGEALALEPQDGDVLNSRGATRTALGQYEDAIADFDRAVTLARGKAVPLSNRCFAKAAAGRLEDALADCDRAVRMHPARLPALVTRGFVYLRLKRADEAIADYDKVLAKRADEPYALFGRAAARLMKGDLRGSDADVVRAEAVKPDIADHMARIGVRLQAASPPQGR
jgi:tetratricopeptide (TPR) repeat protein